MKNFLKKHYMLVVLAVGLIIFDMLALVCPKDLSKLEFYFWGGFVFINLAFILTGVALFVGKGKSAHANGLINLFAVSGAYLAISLIMNLIFMIAGCHKEDANRAGLIVPNIILILIFVVVFVFLYRGESHVREVGEKLTEQAVVLENFEVRVSGLVMLAQDYDVKKALETLHNEVRYSDSMSVPAAAQQENAFMEKIVELQEMLEDENADKEEVLKLVKKASTAWKIRNEFVQIYNSRKG